MARQSITAGLCAALLAACGSDANLGTPGYIEGFAGAAVADEPTAALVGRDLLSAGGTAGDAATGMFFALAMTKPAAAGLMASGICLATHPERDLYTAYVFAAPEGVRAMAAIHARYGRLPWRQSVGPAETFARFGVRLTKAFVDDWQAVRPRSAGLQQLYGVNPQVGDEVRNLDLAGLLGQVRLNGAGAFYRGLAARRLWDAMAAQGIAVDEVTWRDAAPRAEDSTRLELGFHQIAFSPFAGTAGPLQAAMWPGLEDQGIEAFDRLLGASGLEAPESDRQETAWIAVDSFGGAVACSITMGQPFGTGQVAGGVLVANPAVPSAAPVLVTNEPTKTFRAAVANTGAPGWESYVALAAVEEEEPLDQSIREPRWLPARTGGLVAEAGASAPAGAERRGSLGRIHGVSCANGLPDDPLSCRAIADPRGRGFAAISDAPP